MYKCGYWWFELFEMARKLIMNGCLIYIGDPDIRMGVGFITCFVSLLITFSSRPFVSEQLNRLMLSSLAIQCFTNCYCLLLVVKQRVGTSTAVAHNELRGFEQLCVLLNISLIVFPFVIDLFEGGWKKLHSSATKDNLPHGVKFAALSADLEGTNDDSPQGDNSGQMRQDDPMSELSDLHLRVASTMRGEQQGLLQERNIDVNVNVNDPLNEDVRRDVAQLLKKLKARGQLSGNSIATASIGHMGPAALEGESSTRTMDLTNITVEEHANAQKTTSNQSAGVM